MQKIINAQPLPDLHVHVTFADGFSGIVDVAPSIRGEIGEALHDKAFFNRVFVNEFNGIAWENGFDFCPNFLREYFEDKSVHLLEMR
ncbi:MAG: DUF2442 domain-containing protein [Ignavibacteria bacterium]|nr:DUF2442 domain-containing protein [Ignavibacteria bacterium]